MYGFVQLSRFYRVGFFYPAPPAIGRRRLDKQNPPPLSEGSRIAGNSPFTMNVLSPLIESFQSFSTVSAEDMRRASTRSAAPTRWLSPVFDRFELYLNPLNSTIGPSLRCLLMSSLKNFFCFDNYGTKGNEIGFDQVFVLALFLCFDPVVPS